MTAPAAAPAGKGGDVVDGLVDVDPYDDGAPGGVPLYDWSTAPKGELATRRQLRAMGLRPGGHGPAAELKCRNCSFKQRTECRHKALLFRIDLAKKVRPMTLAKEVALDKAMAARQTCPRCNRRYYYCLPLKTLGMCVLRTNGSGRQLHAGGNLIGPEGDGSPPVGGAQLVELRPEPAEFQVAQYGMNGFTHSHGETSIWLP